MFDPVEVYVRTVKAGVLKGRDIGRTCGRIIPSDFRSTYRPSGFCGVDAIGQRERIQNNLLADDSLCSGDGTCSVDHAYGGTAAIQHTGVALNLVAKYLCGDPIEAVVIVAWAARRARRWRGFGGGARANYHGTCILISQRDASCLRGIVRKRRYSGDDHLRRAHHTDAGIGNRVIIRVRDIDRRRGTGRRVGEAASRQGDLVICLSRKPDVGSYSGDGGSGTDWRRDRNNNLHFPRVFPINGGYISVRDFRSACSQQQTGYAKWSVLRYGHGERGKRWADIGEIA